MTTGLKVADFRVTHDQMSVEFVVREVISHYIVNDVVLQQGEFESF